MKEVESYIEAYFGVESKDLSLLGDLFNISTLKKDEFLLKTNQYAKSISFVRKGFLRMFALDENGDKEITQWISGEGMFVTDLSSFSFNTPSRWNIQALTDCELFTISKQEFNSFGKYISNWAELEKLFITKCFITLENRVFSQLSMSAEQKVKNLYDINPEIFIQVPLQYIASMLGMTPETLSRVRKKLIS